MASWSTSQNIIDSSIAIRCGFDTAVAVAS